MRRASLLVVAACSEPATMTPMPVGGCDGMLTIETGLSGNHVDIGAPVGSTNNPPSGGPHFGTWAAWNRQYTALDRGYYLHNAEHGGIIFLYRCDAGCPEIVDGLVAAARSVAIDSSCSSTIKHRVIVTGDPLLPDGVQVAAIAWGYAYTASCVDPYLETFARDHYNNAPEDLCFDGVNFSGTPLD